MDMSLVGNVVTIHIQVIWVLASVVLVGLLLLYAGLARKKLMTRDHQTVQTPPLFH